MSEQMPVCDHDECPHNKCLRTMTSTPPSSETPRLVKLLLEHDCGNRPIDNYADDWSHESTHALVCEFRQLEKELNAAKAENQTLRNAQKACEDCDAPTILQVIAMRNQLSAAVGEREKLAKQLIETQDHFTSASDSFADQILSLSTQNQQLREDLKKLSEDNLSNAANACHHLNQQVPLRDKIDDLQATILSLREAIAAIFKKENGCEDVDKTYNYLLGWSFSKGSKIAEDLQEALSQHSTQELEREWVKRSVLEKCVVILQGIHDLCDYRARHDQLHLATMCRDEAVEALTLARAELDKEKNK